MHPNPRVSNLLPPWPSADGPGGLTNAVLDPSYAAGRAGYPVICLLRRPDIGLARIARCSDGKRTRMTCMHRIETVKRKH